MAPVNGSAKVRRTGKQAPKPVMPAIPLPHVKRQAAAAAAATSTFASAPTIDKPNDEKEVVNGTEFSNENKMERAAPIPVEDTPHVAEPESIESPESIHAAKETETSPDKADAAATVETLPTTNGPTIASSQAVHRTRPTTAKADDSNQSDATALSSVPQSSVETLKAPQGTMAGDARRGPPHKQAQHRTSKLSSSHLPPVSPTRYQLPPQFQPANRPMAIIANGDMPRSHRPPLPNGPHHMHQTHPSNSSVHFGAFHDSQSSSPAPPHSGGIAPPPGMPVPDGHPPHMVGMNGNGFPPPMPYGAEMMPVANFDNYGRPAMTYGPMDSYTPYGNTLGPSTPHSFHDSQSSAPDDAAMYNQYSHGPLRNGTVGLGDDAQGPNHQGRMFGPPDYSRMVPNPGPPPQMISQGDNADGLIGYLQQQFSSPELADCVLELRYTDDRLPPVRIPGHRLVFARSFPLFNLLQKQAFQASPSDRSLQTLLLETESHWIRSDSFYMAVQRLYGLPLLQAPPRHAGIDSVDVTDAGSTLDQLEFALSYAAGGHLLDWSPVIRRGCEEATSLVNWETLERVLEFALDEYSDKASHDVHKFGDGSRILLGAAVTFIVHNFPSHFTLDIDTVDLVRYSRLPIALPPAAPEGSTVDKEATTATMDRSSVQLGKGRRTQQLSGIQFGDISFAEGKNGSATVTPKATRLAQPASYTVLSRILLNIPFTQLKMILESSGSGNVNGWANAESRYRSIKSAVDERENRRLRIQEVVLSGRIPDSEAIRAGLCSPEPRDLGRWSVLGWQEEIVPYGNPDGPSLARKWVPLMDPDNGSIAAYP